MNFQKYKTLLSMTKKLYSFEKIQVGAKQKAASLNRIGKKVCFLRHDIDFSPQNALEIAKLENQLGITSTFTVLLSGKNYNAFELTTRKKLEEIQQLKHQIGLHFDPSSYDIQNTEELEFYLKKEKFFLENLLERPIDMFSFHNTSEFSLSMTNETYAGMENSYSSFYQNEVEYVSDSNGYWRYKNWQQMLDEASQKIQILTHPVWWRPDNELPPFETILNHFFEQFSRSVEQYVTMFEGQSERVNLSLINDGILNIEEANNKKQLLEYAFNPNVLAILSDQDKKNAHIALKIFIENSLRK